MEALVRLNDEEMSCVKDYALRHNTSLSELFVFSVMEKIEDEYDLSIYNKAMEKYLDDRKTFTLDEVEKELVSIE